MNFSPTIAVTRLINRVNCAGVGNVLLASHKDIERKRPLDIKITTM